MPLGVVRAGDVDAPTGYDDARSRGQEVQDRRFSAGFDPSHPTASHDVLADSGIEKGW